MTLPQGEVTQRLRAWGAGDQAALGELMSLVYDELRRLAAGYLRRERPDHTLQPTELVHEAYLRLTDLRSVRWQNRAHFFGIAARLMREILVEHARGRHAVKRGGNLLRITLSDAIAASEERDVDLMALDDALRGLEETDPRKARLVELRFFAGLTIEETAETLDVSAATVIREWRMAKAWLYRRLKKRRES